MVDELAAATLAPDTEGVVVRPPSPPKLEHAPPPPAPTVPASRSDFKTFPVDDDEDVAGGVHKEFSLLLLLLLPLLLLLLPLLLLPLPTAGAPPEPISVGRSS